VPINWTEWERLERQLLRQEFTDVTMDILLAAGSNGAAALPANLSVLIDWDVFNAAALDWLHMYLGDVPLAGRGGAWSWAADLTQSTRKRVVTEIDNWVRAGDELDVLKRRLAPIFGNQRASMIATTEVTRIYAEGNVLTWQASGLVGAKKWMTAVDDRVCPICGPMHMTIVEIDREWQYTAELRELNPELDKALTSIKQDAFRVPPAHVNCRCWLQPVVIEALDPDDLAKQHFMLRQQKEIERRRESVAAGLPPNIRPIRLDANAN
jgi:hypothetical protein